MTEKLTNVTIERDRWGRPMVLPPGAKTKRVPYRRVTTFVSCLDDTYGLMQWKQRQTALGMGLRKDLVLAAAAADQSDKATLNDIAEKACEYALSSASATTGIALHALAERIDSGEAIDHIPTEYQADLDAYQKTTSAIEYTAIETFRVHDEFKVAGTADRIGHYRGRLMVCDIKTGSIDYPHKMAMQLAMYARSLPYDIETDRRGKQDGIDLNTGIIIHLPAGQGRCDLYEIDIAKGWGACLIAKKVWDWRADKQLTHRLGDERDTTWQRSNSSTIDRITEKIAAAETLDDLRDLWRQSAKNGELTDSFRAAARKRGQQLAANTK